MSARNILRLSDFRLLFVGQTVSMAGDAPAVLALTFVVLEIGGSPAALGGVLAARFVPLTGLLLLGGVLADRFPRRELMIAADLTRAATQAVLAVLLAFGAAQLWQIMVLQMIYGGAQALFTPALGGIVAQLVPADSLRAANALVAMSSSLLRVVGPALGAVLIAAAGLGAAVAVDAVTFLISAVVLLGVRRPAASERTAPEPLLIALRTGWREVATRTWLWTSIANFTVFSAVAVPAVLVLGPQVAQLEFGGPDGWAVIMATFAAGAVLGSAVALRISAARPAAVCAALLAVAAARPALLVSGLGLSIIGVYSALSGAAVSMAMVYWRTLLQERIPLAVLSRVRSIDDFGSTLLTPVAYLATGQLAAHTGLHGAMVLLTAIAVAASVATVAVPAVRRVSGGTHAALSDDAAWNGAVTSDTAPGSPAGAGKHSSRRS
ncbi:MFS transporter [Nocardia pseudovaccinii]|uniref:MFS transporter n=1 Tax=Nocardia pseudovaccinii TaxID=189540 RepID=UPI0007A41E54|nr:MFS transporter [Nocardia pseudovaccinii]